MITQKQANSMLEASLRSGDEAFGAGFEGRTSRDKQKISGEQALAQQAAEANARLEQLIKGQELQRQADAEDLAQAQALKNKYGPEADIAVGRARIGGVDPFAIALRRKQLEEAGLTPGQKAADVAFGKEYSDFVAQGGRSTAEKNKQELDMAAKKLEELGKAPKVQQALIRATGALPDALRDFLAPETRAAEEGVRNAVMNSLRQTLGGQFAEKEGEKIFTLAYNPRQTPEENYRRVMAKAEELKKALDQKIVSAELFEKTGSLRGLGAAGQMQQPGAPVMQQQAAPAQMTERQRKIMELRQRLGR